MYDVGHNGVNYSTHVPYLVGQFIVIAEIVPEKFGFVGYDLAQASSSDSRDDTLAGVRGRFRDVCVL